MNFSRVSLLLVLCVAAVVSGTGASGQSELDQIKNFYTYYYMTPQPDKVPAMLRAFVENNLAGHFEDSYNNSIAYLAVKTAASRPEIVQEWLSMFENGTHAQRLFIWKVLRLCGGEEVKVFFTEKLKRGRYGKLAREIRDDLRAGIGIQFDPYEDPVTEPVQIDFLVGEFIFSGSEQAVIRMVESLEPNDSSFDSYLISAAAKKALKYNCRYHRKVLQACEEQSENAGEPIKSILADILAENRIFEVIRQVRAGAYGRPDATGPCEDEQALTDPKAWALACSAVLMERNHSRHDTLNPDRINEYEIKKEKKLIKDKWDINSREDLLGTLEELNTEGHREGFARKSGYIGSLSGKDRKDLIAHTRNNRTKVTGEYYKELGDKGLFGWDYSRFICLCRWGYVAGYISRQEAWAMIMPTAELLQDKFDSWEELGQNYLIGRQFWSKKYTQEEGHLYEDAYNRLLDMRSSPWNRLAWDTELRGLQDCNTPQASFSPEDVNEE